LSKLGVGVSMIIIGEKINGTILAVKEAIDKRDAAFIADRAVKLAEADADFIDVCASTALEYEVETMKWLINVVRKMMGTIFATYALLGQDRHCRKYSKAFSVGKIIM
jgi:cobalamin-dependent methionine synthase I